MSEETLGFQAETARILDIVIHSLYSNKEIFLRELISNASDACDKLRYAAISDPDLLADGESEFKIRIVNDTERKVLLIEDNGIGMNRDDLIANLGTIAKSGTSEFLKNLSGDSKKDVELIGRFGVGFYASFMVADAVEVLTRRAGDDKAYRWRSEGAGEYTIAEAEKPSRGTQIMLYLREDSAEYAEEQRIRHIVKTYSDHISFPVVLMKPPVEGAGAEEAGDDAPSSGDETLNAASALWTRPKSEITDEQYSEFYKHAGHAFDDPWMTLHWRAEGRVEYTALLFVPTMKPFDLYDPQRKGHLKLFVKKVFITENVDELLPPYLRFVKGVVDSEDLPLNISREMLQQQPLLNLIKKGLTSKLLKELTGKAGKDPEAFETFWDVFGPVVKEGLYEDFENRDKLLELVRFRSTAGEGWTSLKQYVERMRDGQEAIYYISGENPEALANSPHLEGFKARDVEVLLLSDPVDEFWIPSVHVFEEKEFKSVTKGGADLGKIAGDEAGKSGDDAEKSDKNTSGDTNLDKVVAAFKLALGDKVKDIRSSERLTDSACVLVADEGDMDMRMERLMKQHNQLAMASARILELNPNHPLVKKLVAVAEADVKSADLDLAAHLLLDQAKIIDGDPVADPAAFASRLAKMMERGVAAS